MSRKSRIDETDGDPNTTYEDLGAHEETTFFLNKNQSDIADTLTEEPADRRRSEKE
ncbi:hypothetical protein [Paenibacillus albus]|uniref:hypothetical protein n=1 Tax=Paenibacillus albus TaxID=2495582 RepID=UPI0013DFEE72|nr:hypothetical protein [Paenibacillus albus]